MAMPIVLVLCFAGSPCVDMSSLKGLGAVGMAGAASSWLYEEPRIRALLRQAFSVLAHGLLENVPSMGGAHRQIITERMGSVLFSAKL